jgi:hypothetical protein
MNPKQADPVIDEVREVRRRISEQFGHDPTRLVAYYMEMQEKFRHRLLNAAGTPAAETSQETGRTGNVERTP